jgi:hypothetical protein
MAGTANRIYKLRGKRQREANNSNLVALFSIGPFERNRVSRAEIDRLRERIDSDGTTAVAREIEVSELTLLRICAGFAHRLQTRTADKVRDYLGA